MREIEQRIAAKVRFEPWEQELVVLSRVNRAYGLAEPLHVTAQRPWWDVLQWQLALYLEAEAARNG